MDKDTHFQPIQTLILQGKMQALEAATTYALATHWNVGAYLSHRLTESTYGTVLLRQASLIIKLNAAPALRNLE
jgi:hypothetical protein